MRDELEHIAQIEAYLDGDMSTEERELFEEQLKNDAGLREEVFFQKEANQLLIIGELHDLEKRVKKHQYNSSQKKINKYKNGAIGLAGLLLLAGLFIYVLNITHTEQLGFSRKVTLTPIPVKKEIPVKEVKKPVKTHKNEARLPVQDKEKSIGGIQKKEAKVKVIQEDTLVVLKPAAEQKKDTVVVQSVTAKKADTKITKEKTKVIPKENSDPGKQEVVEPEEDVFPENETEEQNYDLAFSPSRGQVLNWPIEEYFEGTILLYNINGKIIYEKRFRGELNAEWDGIINTGDVISFGVYPMIIYSENGKKPIQGSVTVVE